MFTRLSNLCKHRNKDVSHRAFFALNTFLKQVSDEIVSSNRSEESNIDTFKVIQIFVSSSLCYYSSISRIISFLFVNFQNCWIRNRVIQCKRLALH